MQGLHDETVHKLVDQSVGMITLDCGYQLAHQASLDILADVCCDYLRKISTLLRVATDTEDWRDTDCDFVDSLERVFHQVNIPSAANLHQFICKMEAIKKHQSQTLKTAAKTTDCSQQAAKANQQQSALNSSDGSQHNHDTESHVGTTSQHEQKPLLAPPLTQLQ